jgi:hypothetical protein
MAHGSLTRKAGFLRRLPRRSGVGHIDQQGIEEPERQPPIENAPFLVLALPPDSKAVYDPKRSECKRHNGALICLAV